MIKAVIFDMFETLITHYNSPLYFGAQLAVDAGIDNDVFHKTWKSAEKERMTGKITLKDILENILRENNRYSDEFLSLLIKKRVAAKEEVFNHLHPEVLPLLDTLKKSGVTLALISNCYSEEVEPIKNSLLYPYFDAALLSYEEGVLKPDEKIFIRCLEKLKETPTECLYVGDGGSNELFAAQKIGMHAVQARWYLREHNFRATEYMPQFDGADSPLEIVNFI